MTTTADVLFSWGLPHWPDLNDSDYEWLLLTDGWVADPTAQWVDDVSAHELTDGSYSRVVVSGSAASWDPSEQSWTWDADDPAFGSLVGGETVAWCVLFRRVTDDSDSPLLAAFRVAKITDGSPVTVVLDPFGLHRQRVEAV